MRNSRNADVARVVRGVPLALARARLAQIADLARQAQSPDSLCRHWPPERFAEIERIALALVESPPANLAAVAMDELQSLRQVLGDDLSRFSNVLEEVYSKPDWRIAYLAYLVPFGLALLGDAAKLEQLCVTVEF